MHPSLFEMIAYDFHVTTDGRKIKIGQSNHSDPDADADIVLLDVDQAELLIQWVRQAADSIRQRMHRERCATIVSDKAPEKERQPCPAA